MKKILSAFWVFLIVFAVPQGGTGGWNAQAMAVEPFVSMAVDFCKQKSAVKKSSDVKVLAGEYIWPIANDEGILSCRLNCECKTHKGSHKGVDIGGQIDGKAVKAVKTGTVEGMTICARTHKESKACNDCRGLGTSVTLKHKDGKTSQYCHLQANSLTVSATADKELVIEQGEKIGNVGNTGFSKSAHLHFVMRDEDGSLLNPEDYLPIPAVKNE